MCRQVRAGNESPIIVKQLGRQSSAETVNVYERFCPGHAFNIGRVVQPLPARPVAVIKDSCIIGANVLITAANEGLLASTLVERISMTRWAQGVACKQV